MIYFETGGRGEAWHHGFEEFQSSALQKVFQQKYHWAKKKKGLHIKMKKNKRFCTV